MNHSPCVILRNWLVSKGHFILPSSAGTWPLYSTFLPDIAPDNTGCVYDGPPQIDARAMQTGEITQHFLVTLRLRCVPGDYNTGYVKLLGIMEALGLISRETVTVDSSTYTLCAVTNLSGVVSLGVEGDTKRRRLFEMELSLSIEAP